LGILPTHVDAVSARKIVRQFKPDGLISHTVKIDRELLLASSKLRAISKHGSGVDNIDLVTARELGVSIVAATGANAQSVAEHAAALMLALGRRIVQAHESTVSGTWDRAAATGLE